MALSSLDDKSQVPTEEDLDRVLGASKVLWDRLVAGVAKKYPPLTEKWGFAGKKWGWSLALKQKKRAIVYLTPATSFFYAGYALGEKAVSYAKNLDLSTEILELIDSSPKYAEGRGVRIEVKSEGDVKQVLLIAEAKMSK
jgi:hypothetical protein